MSTQNVDLAVERLENSLRQLVETRSGFGDESKQERTLLEIFSEFDRDGSGYLDEDEFEAVMVQRLNAVGSRQAIEELFDRFDEDVSGKISYEEFASELLRRGNNNDSPATHFANETPPWLSIPTPAHTTPTKSSNNRTNNNSATRAQRKMNESTQPVVEQVKAALLLRAGNNVGVRGCARLLRSMDTDGSKSLSRDELIDGMMELGVRLSTGDATKVIMHFDRDRSGRVSTEELLRGLRGKMSRKRKKLVRRAWEVLCNAAGVDGPMDYVTLQDMLKVYDVSKHPGVMDGSYRPEQAMQEFMAGWDRDGDLRVTWIEFLDYYRDLSAGVEQEDYFELMIRNCWHISGGKGWAENTSNTRVLVTHTDGRQAVHEIKDDFAMVGHGKQLSTQELIKCLRASGVENVSEVSLFG